MARKLSADDICEAIAELGETTRAKLVADILADLKQFSKEGPNAEYPDTWADGFRAAMEIISSNY